MTPDPNRASKVHSQETREDIARLRDFGPFRRYFTARQEQRLAQQREKVLTDVNELDTPQKLWEARLIYLERLEAAQMMERDEIAAQRTIGGTSPSEL